MISNSSSIAASLALAAALSMAATPASAVELPVVGKSETMVQTGAAEDQAGHRWRRYRHRTRTGDVLAGVLILGTIAAVASSSRSRDRDYRYRDRDYRYRDRDYRYRDRNYRGERYDRRDHDGARGMERAVEMCIDQIERGRDRVDEIGNASRVSDGWRVSGSLNSGAGWDCWIDNDGRIRSIDIGGGSGFSSYESEEAGRLAGAEEQWSDQDYARARAQSGSIADSAYVPRDNVAAEADGPQPAYPGGPLPGEEGEEVDGDLYTTASL